MTTENKEYDATGLSSDEIAILEGTETETAVEETPKAAENPDTGTIEAEKAETDGDNPAADPTRPDKFVPYQALKAERERAKELEKRADEAMKWQRAIAEKLAEARANPQQQEQPKEHVPNRDEDPIGYIEYMDKRLAAIEQERQQIEQQNTVERQWQEFEQDVNREITQAMAEEPTYGEAMEFVNRALAFEWQKLYQHTGLPLEQYARDIKRQHAAYARQNRIPIAQYVRNVAEARGYVPGILSQKAEAAQPDNAAAAKIDAIADAQSKNRTLGKNSSGIKSDFTLEDLASMSGAELERFAAKNPELFDRIAAGQ